MRPAGRPLHRAAAALWRRSPESTLGPDRRSPAHPRRRRGWQPAPILLRAPRTTCRFRRLRSVAGWPGTARACRQRCCTGSAGPGRWPRAGRKAWSPRSPFARTRAGPRPALAPGRTQASEPITSSKNGEGASARFLPTFWSRRKHPATRVPDLERAHPWRGCRVPHCSRPSCGRSSPRCLSSSSNLSTATSLRSATNDNSRASSRG